MALQHVLPTSENPAPGVGSFAPDGAGEIIDNLVGPTGMEFLSVMGTDGAVFYIVIDRHREGDNVYLLRAVASQDLVPMASDAEEYMASLEDGRDLTNEELFLMLAELVAAGIVVHMPDGAGAAGTGAAYFPAGLPGALEAEPAGGPSPVGSMLAFGAMGAGGVGLLMYWLWVRRRNRSRANPEDEDSYESGAGAGDGADGEAEAAEGAAGGSDESDFLNK